MTNVQKNSVLTAGCLSLTVSWFLSVLSLRIHNQQSSTSVYKWPWHTHQAPLLRRCPNTQKSACTLSGGSPTASPCKSVAPNNPPPPSPLAFHSPFICSSSLFSLGFSICWPWSVRVPPLIGRMPGQADNPLLWLWKTWHWDQGLRNWTHTLLITGSSLSLSDKQQSFLFLRAVWVFCLAASQTNKSGSFW